MNGDHFCNLLSKPYILFLIFLLSHILYFLNLHKKNSTYQSLFILRGALFESHEPHFTNEPLHFDSVQGPSAGSVQDSFFQAYT
jgi:hypothetical protein